MKPPPEKDIQRRITALCRSLGCAVYSTSQYRMSGVTPGMPDLYVVHARKGVWFWFECKKPQAVAGFDLFKPETWVPQPLRTSQVAFHAGCLATGQPYHWGGPREAEAALVAAGLGEVRDGVFWGTP